MSPAEKAARHIKLYKVVTTHTSHTWAAVLVKMLLGQMDGQGQARQTPYIPREDLEGSYKRASKRLFLFDYDVSFSIIAFCGMRLLLMEPLSVVGNTCSDCQDTLDGRSLVADA